MKKIVVLLTFCLLLQTVFAQNSTPLKDCRADFSWMANGLTMMFYDASTSGCDDSQTYSVTLVC